MSNHEQDPTNGEQTASPERPAPSGELTQPPRPGIWVATSPDALSGTWWDASGTPERLRERIGDGRIYDSIDFGPFAVREGEDPATVAAVANGIREHGYAFAAWAELHDADPDMLAGFTEHYLGRVDSLDDFGRQLAAPAAEAIATSFAEVAAHIRIDYAAIADAELASARVVALRSTDGRLWLFHGPTWEPDADAPTGPSVEP